MNSSPLKRVCINIILQEVMSFSVNSFKLLKLLKSVINSFGGKYSKIEILNSFFWYIACSGFLGSLNLFTSGYFYFFLSIFAGEWEVVLTLT